VDSKLLGLCNSLFARKILTRDVFVVPPIDFVGSHAVWRLKKPIYGIVSAPKSWFDRLMKSVGHLD
jgi:hypothetical protein